MSMKVTVTTHVNNPAATFWNRLGGFMTYAAPLVGFVVLFAGLPIADQFHLGKIFWVFWVILSIVAAIAFFILSFGFCAVMEHRALDKAAKEAGSPVMPGNDPRASAEWKPNPHPEFDPTAPASGDTIDLTKTVEEVNRILENESQGNTDLIEFPLKDTYHYDAIETLPNRSR